MVNFAVSIIGLLVLDLTKAFSLVKTLTNPRGVVKEGGSLLLSCKGRKFSEAVFLLYVSPKLLNEIIASQLYHIKLIKGISVLKPCNYFEGDSF